VGVHIVTIWPQNLSDPNGIGFEEPFIDHLSSLTCRSNQNSGTRLQNINRSYSSSNPRVPEYDAAITDKISEETIRRVGRNMSELSIDIGTVVSIPCNDYYVVAKVLFLSDRMKNVALYKIFDHKASLDKPYIDVISSSSFDLVYTGIGLIKKGEWPILAHLPLLDSEKESSMRIAAGNVWLANEYLRPATDEDYSSIPRMLVANVKGVERRVADYPIF